jgi:hypothetical protein
MAQKDNPIKETPKEGFVFSKNNYRLMVLSIIAVFFGFMLMIGDTNIYEFRKIVLAPIVVLIGFAIGFVAILKK